MRYFKFYESFKEAFEMMPNEQKMELFDALLKYEFDGTDPDFGDDKWLPAIFTAMTGTIDALGGVMDDE